MSSRTFEPHNRLVADTLESEWNDKLRMLADLQEERGRALREDQLMLDDAIHDRLTAMTSDFKVVWCDPTLPNRERKRLLAYLVEDVTLLKFPAEGERVPGLVRVKATVNLIWHASVTVHSRAI